MEQKNSARRPTHLHLLEVEDLLLAGLYLDLIRLVSQAAQDGTTANLHGSDHKQHGW